MSAFTQAAQPSGEFLKFKQVGTEHAVQIEKVDEKQATDFRTKEPLTFPSGDKIMEQWIIGQAWSDEEGDMVDAVMVIDSKRKRAAIGEALIEHDLDDLQKGGVIKLKFTGYAQGASTDNPPKDYAAEYIPAEPAGSPWN